MNCPIHIICIVLKEGWFAEMVTSVLRVETTVPRKLENFPIREGVFSNVWWWLCGRQRIDCKTETKQKTNNFIVTLQQSGFYFSHSSRRC